MSRAKEEGPSPWKRHRTLIGCAVSFGAATLLMVDLLVLGLGERFVTALARHPVSRLESLERRSEREPLADLLPHLEALDRDFPAKHGKHALDEERERLLLKLALSYEASGRRRLAEETLKRLVAFDPRNFRNHEALAHFGLRTGDDNLAEDAFRGLFGVNPFHEPAIAACLKLLFDGSRFPEVATLVSSYATEPLVAEVRVVDRGKDLYLGVMADGNEQVLQVPVTQPAGAVVDLSLHLDGRPGRVIGATAHPPRIFGQSTPSGGIELRVWIDESEKPGPVWSNEAVSGVIRIQGPSKDLPSGVDSVQIRLRIWKPISRETRVLAGKAFRNLLRSDEFSELERAFAIFDGETR